MSPISLVCQDKGGAPQLTAYSINFVASALEFFADPPHRPVASFESKRFTNLSPSLPQLGDAVTIAVLKILDRNELLAPKETNSYLLIVREAFSDRTKVTEKTNADPKATFFVLDYLQEKVGDRNVQKRIAYLRQCIPHFNCSPHEEYVFKSK